MWQEVDPKQTRLGLGEVGVHNHGKGCRLYFGAKAVKRWGLSKYKTVRTSVSEPERGFLGIQFYLGTDGEWALAPQKGSNGMNVYCESLLDDLDVEPGRYSLRRDDSGMFIINFKAKVA